MSGEFAIRFMESNDLDTLNLFTFTSFPRFFHYVATHKQYSKPQVLVAEAQGIAVGFIKIVEFKVNEEKFGFISGVAVKHEFHRKGIGTALVEAGTQVLKEDGAKTVFATAQMTNRASLKVFSRQGFRKVSFLGLWRLFGKRIFEIYEDIWFFPGEIVLIHD